MQKTAAQKLVQETLQSSFDKERFVYLVKNVVNHFEEAPFTYKGNFIFDDFADSIRLVERVGKYKGPDEKLIDILIVHLQKETSLERARTKQRNFVAKYLKGSRGRVLKDAALVAFVAPNGADWRFSLVKMEYKFNEKGKVEEEFTPARRYSFLVGQNENSHTAQSRLLPILSNDEVNPTLEELEEVFSVERVTKEFFEKYRDLFLRLKEALDEVVKKDAKVKADFKEKNIDTADFCKKLLGQIVFLYFLQKKGWFGVKRGEEWGSGSKHFLRELFDKKHGDYKNFFNDILEPLFYEALRLERSGDYYSRFNCRIPFLNGGLFDPLAYYDWWKTDILLPDELFSNSRKTKEGDTGDGILDIFDRYNFTVKEDEPLEKEVAVDPEMLGKVFENLLEVKDRKSKGTYYTPREIVHYMCQESLANYLATELEGKASKEDIETLIKYGETVVEHDSRVASEGRETERYSFKLPRSVRKHAKLIDEKLASIRVCDPAVGSGAFPVGMMNEIIRTRNALTPYIGKDGERTPYHFKREAIQNCLYGVDIDPGAVEIAKLRLWLSLVVDEEERDNIQPLPNLDYKIVQGNSLLSVEKNLFNAALFSKLEELKPLYFNETSASKKQEYRNQIDELISQITNGHKDFDFEVYFSEVFHEKKGFDVVIANPPYLSSKNIDENLKPIYEKSFYSPTAHYDIYIIFIERALQLLRRGNCLCFITSNKYFSQKYGSKIREILLKNQILRIVNFNFKIFEATVDTAITIVRNSESKSGHKVKVLDLHEADLGNKDRLSLENILFDKSRYQIIEQKFFEELPDSNFRLDVHKEDFDLRNKIHGNTLPLEEVCFVIYGAVLHNADKKVKKDKFIFQERSDGLKPYIEGKFISRWRINKINYLKYTPTVHREPRYPELFENPKLIGKRIIGREGLSFIYDQNKLYTDNTVYLVIPYHYLPKDKYSQLKSVINHDRIESSKEYSLLFLLSVINSHLFKWLFQKFFSFGLDIYPAHIKKLPIKVVEKNQQRPFIDFVDKILAITKDGDYLENPAKQAKVRDYEKQIDQLVYKLYGLTPEEVKVIETNQIT
jgi:hypothetical protein